MSWRSHIGGLRGPRRAGVVDPSSIRVAACRWGSKSTAGVCVDRSWHARCPNVSHGGTANCGCSVSAVSETGLEPVRAYAQGSLSPGRELVQRCQAGSLTAMFSLQLPMVWRKLVPAGATGYLPVQGAIW